MILGLKTKNRKNAYVQLDYIINLVEIKPWPPSHSLKSLRSALIQWEHGDKNSGTTKAVAPSNVSGSGIGDGKIEFNESFRVHVTLLRDLSVKTGDNETFLRNCIEFNMYEPRRDKGQLLATAIVDFAEYGIIEESLMISVPMNCKRAFGNKAQPMLFVKIHTVEKDICVRSSSKESLFREGLIYKNHSESVSALMNEEYAEEAETASITDDDISSHSSMAADSSTIKSNGYSSSTSQTGNQNGSEATRGTSENVNDQGVSVQDKMAAYEKQISSSKDLYSELESVRNALSNIRNSKLTMLQEKAKSYNMKQPKPSIANDETNEQCCIQIGNFDASQSGQESHTIRDFGVEADRSRSVKSVGSSLYSGISNSKLTMLQEKAKSYNMKQPNSSIANDETNEQCCIQLGNLDASQSGQESHTIRDFGFEADRSKSVKSVGSSFVSGISNGSVRTSKVLEKLKYATIHDQNSGRKDLSKVQHLEKRVQVLEGELREAAGIEVSLYSIVAEHGSSINKVHAPARRLSRLYLHACKQNSSRRASSARSIVSGLILVAKACGNDVPRLTFWLSNAVVLRAIIHKTIEKEQGNNEIASSLKWRKDSALKESRNGLPVTSNEREDPCMVTSALEKVESWIFSLVIESIWWQTFAHYMQSTAANGIVGVVDFESCKSCKTSGSLDRDEQVNVSFEHWKTAFMEACEKICPVRAAGHNCGCLSLLSMLIMEQCTGRLDAAMFNAILRESDDEGPTDPVSDPISDAGVLPISSGKASFGAGALLKKTIGKWSSLLTDLFGSPISFHLLTALSELMMLPKDMLLSNTIRKEVCPTFGVPLIKRILDSFVPDEFCPDPIPEVVLEALDSEDLIETSEDCVTSIPYAAAPIVYHPPSASLVGCILGDNTSPAHLSRSGSSILQKSNTSDDELDELDSPLTSIIDTRSRAVAASVKPMWPLKDLDSCNNIRYQLLKEVWMNSD